MKKIFLAAILFAVSSVASASTWWHNGLLYGNVCRSGAYFTVYPSYNAQLVGSSCPVRDGFGNVVLWGYVSDE